MEILSPPHFHVESVEKICLVFILDTSPSMYTLDASSPPQILSALAFESFAKCLSGAVSCKSCYVSVIAHNGKSVNGSNLLAHSLEISNDNLAPFIKWIYFQMLDLENNLGEPVSNANHGDDPNVFKSSVLLELGLQTLELMPPDHEKVLIIITSGISIMQPDQISSDIIFKFTSMRSIIIIVGSECGFTPMCTYSFVARVTDMNWFSDSIGAVIVNDNDLPYCDSNVSIY